MAEQHILVTGATGFVGSHLAEACMAHGFRVSTLARPQSDTRFLEERGVLVQRGDLTDAEAVRRATANVDGIIHCAAKVGDWGPVADYRQINVEGLRHLLEACRDRPVQRFLHVSSLGVYAARNHYGTDETEPLPARHIDAYTQTKVEAEHLAMEYHQKHQLPIVILRPGFIYGPRDRTVLPRLLESLRARQLRYLGSTKRAMNTIYVGNLIHAIFLALESPSAPGQVYNLTDGESVSKRRFIEALAEGLELPKPSALPVPLWLARILAWGMDRKARFRGATEAPLLTPARIKFMGMNLDFSIAKARRELHYEPRFSFAEGMAQTMAWYRENGYTAVVQTAGV